MNDPDTPSPEAGASAQPLSESAMQQAAARSRALAASLGAVVAILMRSPEYRNAALSDIEKLIGPAIGFDQVAIVEARDPNSGIVAPVAAVLWAQVSPEIDQRLSDTANPKPQLEPRDWKSGPIPWIITAVGAKGAVSKLLEQLVKARFADTPPKIRVRDKDGQSKIGFVRVNEAGNAAIDGATMPS